MILIMNLQQTFDQRTHLKKIWTNHNTRPIREGQQMIRNSEPEERDTEVNRDTIKPVVEYLCS